MGFALPRNLWPQREPDQSTCFQRRRFLMRGISVSCTPYSLAIAACDRASHRIARTLSASSFAIAWASPFRALPRLTRSCVLSFTVPTAKWSGLMQRGLSQPCKTSPAKVGNGRSCASAYDALCARSVATLPRFVLPYPSLHTGPRHSRQPFGISSLLASNRALRLSLICGRDIFAVISNPKGVV